MTADIADVLEAGIKLDAAFDNWDQPPQLDLIIRNEEVIALHDMNVPRDLWANQDPLIVVQALTFAGKVMGRLPLSLLPEGEIIGAVLHTEAWALNMDPSNSTQAECDEAMEWCKAHSIEDHPRGIEVKMMYGVAVDGHRYMLVFPRDAEEPQVVTQHPGQTEGAMDGRMVGIIQEYLDIAVASRS